MCVCVCVCVCETEREREIYYKEMIQAIVETGKFKYVAWAHGLKTRES